MTEVKAAYERLAEEACGLPDSLMSYPAIRALFVSSVFIIVMGIGLKAAPTLAPSGQRADWGQPDAAGVQMRVQPLKRVWQSNETPSLTVDLRNSGPEEVWYFGLAQECLIEVDGFWYIWYEPISINMPPRQLDPAKESDGAITVPLTDIWIRTTNADAAAWDVSMGNRAHLKLSPGRHTVRVKFRPKSTEKPINANSNPIEIDIEVASSATGVSPGR